MGAADLELFAQSNVEALLIPKINAATDLDRVGDLATDKRLWAMIETPAGVLNASEIAAHPALDGFVLGTNDLAKDLNCRSAMDRLPLLTSLQLTLLAAKQNKVVCIDGVYNAFKDDEGLRRECIQGRDFGMDGKSLIHPAQVAIANEIFAPSTEDIELARRQIAAFEDAIAEGKGVEQSLPRMFFIRGCNGIFQIKDNGIDW